MAELVLGIHFIIVMYLVLGFPIAVYFNHRLFRIVHTSWLVAVSLLMVFKIPCPFTIWEETLRGGSLYKGSFLATWMNKIIYLEGVKPIHVVYIDVAFAILVASSFLWRPLPPLNES
jgi:hypothetical protein